MLIFGLILLVAVLVANGFGLLLAQRTEMATLALGAVLTGLSAIEWLAARRSGLCERMPAAGVVFGAGLFFAGLFDRLDLGRLAGVTDWLGGFAAGVIGATLLTGWVIRRRPEGGEPFRMGEIPCPHWEAPWIAMAWTMALLAERQFHNLCQWAGQPAPVWGGWLAALLAGTGVAALVQWRRFRRLSLPRLSLVALCVVLALAVEEASPGVYYPAMLLAACLIVFGGGAYELSVPSGTLSEGIGRLAHWGFTVVLATFLTWNMAASLLNQTVTRAVARYGSLAPVSEEAFMRLVLHDAYLWHYDLPAGQDDNASAGAHNLLASQRAAGRDKFSAAWETRTLRKQPPQNPGVFLTRRGKTLHVAYVIPGSPADKAGVRRGWTVRVAAGEGGNSDPLLFFDANDDLELVQGGMEKMSGVDVRVDRQAAPAVGYLYLDAFDLDAEKDLDAAFDGFLRAGVGELVVDLRYNPGGRVDTLAHLANLIAGNRHAGEVMYRLQHNFRYADADRVGRFQRTPHGLDVSRLFVLVSRDSCSASELLVAALKPYLPVVVIGEPTCGKPYGSQTVRFGKRSYSALSFTVSNANGFGHYKDGLAPDCYLTDAIRQPFQPGTRDDPMYRAALGYMATGKCAPGWTF